MLDVKQIEFAECGLLFWFRRWYRSPLLYVIEYLNESPTHQQAAILKAFERHRFVAVASGHGIGKTRLESWMTHWWLDTRGKRCPITGGSGGQLDDIVWAEIIQTNGIKWKFIQDQYEVTSDELRCKWNKDNHKVVKRTTRMENPDALQGFHDCFFILEEASGIPDKIFEVAKGAFGDPGNYGLMIGNPTKTSGYMYKVFHSHKTFWFRLQFSSENSMSDTVYRYSYVDPFGDVKWVAVRGRQEREWIENLKEEYGEFSNIYKYRIKGEFANASGDNVIDRCMTDSVWDGGLHDDATCKKIMGVDVAREGDDDSAVVIRQGRNILHAESWHIPDTVLLSERIKLLQEEWHCDDINIDTIGVGGGVFDILYHAGFPVHGIDANSKAPEFGFGKVKFRRLRDYLWWQSRHFYRTQTVRYAETSKKSEFERLRTELSEPLYEIDCSSRVCVEQKLDLKKRGIRSPNLADAHNMTLFGDNTYHDIFGERTKRLVKKKTSRVSWKCV